MSALQFSKVGLHSFDDVCFASAALAGQAHAQWRYVFVVPQVFAVVQQVAADDLECPHLLFVQSVTTRHGTEEVFTFRVRGTHCVGTQSRELGGD